MEFKRWCPGLKILTYFGSQKERKLKRTGWSKDNSFHVCITSYKLVIQDHFAFRRKKWYYMVLDEAQSIKNFRSQRWQTLLRFNTKRRLLLTGTPLQNDVMELWSLMHFLMPHIFTSQQDFKEWFSNPFNQSMNQSQALNLMVVQRLQSILRPFLLRRMKKDVEKQLPEKIEHIVKCELSRRQRLLYDEYINNNNTQRTLHQADFFSIMNVLMQLRKVCNHPDLFEPRAIESPLFQMQQVTYNCPRLIWKALDKETDQLETFQKYRLILRDNEGISKKTFASQIENMPQKSLVEILQTNRARNNGDPYSQRPMNEDDLIELLRPTGKSAAKNNESGKFDPNLAGSFVLNYLGAATVPFLSSYFSLNDIQELRAMSKGEKFNQDTAFESALQYENLKRKLIKFGEKLITFAHADYINRTKLMTSPVFGKDCIEACKIPLTFDSVMRHRKGRASRNFKELEVPQTIFNPLCTEEEKKQEVMYNRFTNHTFTLENAPIYEDEVKKDLKLNRSESNVSQDSKPPIKRVMRQPGFPLVIELKSKRNKNKSRKPKPQILNMPYKPKVEGQGSLSPVYSNLHGKVMYVMSAKLVKNVSISFPKSLLHKNTSEPTSTIEKDIKVEVTDKVFHYKKKIKPSEEPIDIYEKEYNTTSEYRRMKNRDTEEKDPDCEKQDVTEEDQQEDQQMQEDQVKKKEAEEGEKKDQEMKDEQEKEEKEEQVEEKQGEDRKVSEEGNKESEVKEEGLDDQKEENDARAEEYDESDEEYSGEGCFIGYRNTDGLRNMIVTPMQRFHDWNEKLRHFKFITPKVRTKPGILTISKTS